MKEVFDEKSELEFITSSFPKDLRLKKKGKAEYYGIGSISFNYEITVPVDLQEIENN